MNATIKKCINRAPIIMPPIRLLNIYHTLSQILAYGVEGDVIECGCYTGSSTTLIKATMEYYKSDKKLHVFDSFKGLTSFHPSDGRRAMRLGRKLNLVSSVEGLQKNFLNKGLKLPIINKGFVEETIPDNLPEKICYMHLDMDLYAPTMHVLKHTYDRMPKGAIAMLDDYEFWSFPGIKRCVDEFLFDKPEEMISLYAAEVFRHASHGYFRKE